MKDPRFRTRQRPRRVRRGHQATPLQINWFVVGLTLMSWMVMSFVVFWIEPSLIKDVLWPGAYLPFVGLLWVTSLITIRLVSGHWGQGLFSGTCLTIVLALRLYQILTWLNLLAILGLWVVVVYYFLGLRATLKESLAKPTAAGADSTDAADQ